MSGQEGYQTLKQKNKKKLFFIFYFFLFLIIIHFPSSRIREKIFSQQDYTIHAQHKTHGWDSCK